MKKKIKELTDRELFIAIFTNADWFKLVSYQDRKGYPNNSNEPAINISYDNCRFCKRCHDCWRNDCKPKDINYGEIRNSIYAEDEVEVDE